MKFSISSDRFGTSVPNSKMTTSWRSGQFSDSNSQWESFPQLWERAQLLRSFIWSQESADEKILFKQFLTRARRFFSVDFCFVALFADGGKIFQLALPEDAVSTLPANFVGHALDLITHSRVPVTWKQLGKDSGLKSVVVVPLLPAVGQPLGFFMLGHKQLKHFVQSELFLLQLLAGELSWAIRELRSKESHQRQMATVSHELKNSLNVIIGDCALLREDLEQSLAQGERDELSNIETTSQEILSLVNSLLDSTVVNDSSAAVAGESIELLPFIEDILMPSREKAKRAGIELKIDYASDLPAEISGDSVRLRHVARNLVDYAVESLWQDSGRLHIKKNGEMLEFTVSGSAVQAVLETRSPPRDESSDPRAGVVFSTKLELIKEHVKFLMGHVHIVNRPDESSDITVCIPCE